MTDEIETDELSADEIAEVAKTDETVSEIARAMAEIKKAMAAFTAEVAPLKEMHAKFNDEREEIKQEYYNRLAKIKEQDDAISAKLKDMAQRQREMEKLAESYERQLLQAVKVKRSADELARITGDWDKLTTGAPWRELAKPHQIEAAKKMAFYRGVILADVMGLGKTLSAIATCDLIKAKTSEGETWTVNKYHQTEYIWSDEIGDKVLRPEFAECEYCQTGTRSYGHYGNVIMTGMPAGRRILYVSPAELVRNVEPEWIRWAPHRQKPVIMAKRTKLQRDMMLDVLEDLDEFVVQLNYEVGRKDWAFIERLIEVGKFDTIILDEAHNIKDRASLAYRQMRRIIDGMDKDGENRLADKIRYVFPMTGTPILNRPQELYTLLTLVDDETWPANDYGERQFLNDYCDKDWDTNKWKFRPGGLTTLSHRIGNRFLRRDLQSAGIILPPQTVQFHELTPDDELYPKQSWARKEMRTKAMIMIDEEKTLAAAAMIAVYTRLRQIETWPAGIVLRDKDGDIILKLDVEESQKIDYIIHNNSEGYAGLLTEVCPDQRAVVYSQFKEPLREMARRAMDAGLRAVILDGDTPERIRNEIKIDFDRNRCRANGRIPQYDVVFANYRVGGAGINLTDVTQTIILDEEWSPGKRDQAYGRTFRIGQTEETTVHVIRMERTIDTWLAGIIESKEEIVGGFEGSMANLKDEFLEALRNGEIY